MVQNGTNTRVKDLVDMVLIQALATFEAGRLRAALEATFAARGLQALPTALPQPPVAWSAPYRTLAHEVGLPQDLATGFRAAAVFLDPLLSGTVEGGARWSAGARTWES